MLRLSAFADLGVEGNDCIMIRTGKSKKKFGTYAMLFVSHFAFLYRIRDPICSLVHLQVLYTSLDGAQSNRNFVKYILGGEFCKPFKLKNPYNFKQNCVVLSFL